MEHIEKIEFVKNAEEFVNRNAKVIRDAKAKEELTYKDTIQEIVRGDKYMIVQYCKGGWIEYHIHTIAGYDEEEKSWCDGDYAYSLEGAFATYLRYINSDYIKTRTQMEREEKYGLDYMTLLEISEKTIDLLKDEDDAEYIWEDLGFEDKKYDYYGIERR